MDKMKVETKCMCHGLLDFNAITRFPSDVAAFKL